MSIGSLHGIAPRAHDRLPRRRLRGRGGAGPVSGVGRMAGGAVVMGELLADRIIDAACLNIGNLNIIAPRRLWDRINLLGGPSQDDPPIWLPWR